MKMTSTNSRENIDFSNAIKITSENFHAVKNQLPSFSRSFFKLLIRIRKGALYAQMPNGQQVCIDSGNDGPVCRVVLHNWSLLRRVIFGGTIGVAESYMDGDWDSDDISQMLQFFLANTNIYHDVVSQSWLINISETIRHWLNRNNKAGSKRNIAAHYDLGNDFYTQWLDPSMTYSSAIYKDGVNSLEDAQREKYRHLAEKIGIKPNDHVLEIGCGWGGFAEYVAGEIGAKVTGLTISQEQLDYARARIKKAGLEHLVELKFQDYRDETEKYDHVASIEMFEAVGEQYWPTYFDTVKRCLKPGGTAGLQIITINRAGYETYRKRPDFIQKYIFPGGMLPSVTALESVTTQSGLQLDHELAFGPDYARTLAEWRVKFWDKWEDIKPLGFDERFKRMWEFYLFYCEAGFTIGSINVRQMFYKHV